MADYHREATEGVTLTETLGGKPQTLVVSPEHLMNGVKPEEAGIRHLIKEAMPEVAKFPRVVLEHDGRKRVLKENGFSIEPYYEEG